MIHLWQSDVIALRIQKTLKKPTSVNIFPNPSKGLFYIDIPDYNGPVIMKISDQPGKLLETHHLMYSGLMTWRWGKGFGH
ncbi:MAG: hypothetical protein IPJ13_26260 [Saprospiraceae bacterium]|nr:hypothetical protein [Saprospiraceae bacterium]